MLLYKARQRVGTRRWDYTYSSPRLGTSAVGYCGGWHPWSEEDRKHYGLSDERYSQMLAHRTKYHDDGHATKEEAELCYKTYLLDNCLRLNASYETPMKCRHCGLWTAYAARVSGHTIIPLCDIHRTKELVRQYFEVHESWES